MSLRLIGEQLTFVRIQNKVEQLSQQILIEQINSCDFFIKTSVDIVFIKTTPPK